MDENINVLLLEDSSTDAELILRELEKDGLSYASQRVESKPDFRKALIEFNPDVILVDYRLTGTFDGLEALKMINSQASEIPCIFVSGTIGEEHAVELMKLGASDYVLKNNLIRLPAAVKQALETRRIKQAQRKAEQELQEQWAFFSKVIDHDKNLISVKDRQNRIILANQSMADFFGTTVDNLIEGIIPKSKETLALLNKIRDEELEVIETRQDKSLPDVEMFDADGSQRWLQINLRPITEPSGQETMVLSVATDVTQRKLAEQELNRMAYRDRLTGQLSRNGFIQFLSHRLKYEDWDPASLVVMVDINGQRDINAAHGYDTGDALLIQLGQRLSEYAGEHGFVGRIGGDEYILFLSSRPNLRAEQQLSALVSTLTEPFVLESLTLKITHRLGYTHLYEEIRCPEDLIREAELAMFRHRVEASNPWVAYTRELDHEVQERIQITSALRAALEEEQFTVHYQPKVELKTGKMVGCEALLRWNHPEHGLQSPGVFIPIAEQSQLIGPIGDWVLRAACRQLRHWHDEGFEVVQVSVNVSLVQFLVGDFVAKVCAALTEFDLDPADLTLEVTESVFERESESLLNQIRALHKMGVRLSLDDFGTGYSSLLYLQKYPFDEIKIDKGFVNQLIEDDYSYNIVTTVIGLAGAHGAEVMAEGIESAEINNALQEMGCYFGQGFYFSMPLAAEEFRWLLEKCSNLPLVDGISA